MLKSERILLDPKKPLPKIPKEIIKNSNKSDLLPNKEKTMSPKNSLSQKPTENDKHAYLLTF